MHQLLFFTPKTILSSLTFDPLSIFFIFVILLVSIPSAVYSISYLKGEYPTSKIVYAWVMLITFVSSMLFVVTLGNAFLFLLAWEIMSITSYFLVIFDSEEAKSVRAGIIYLLMTHIGTAFIMTAFLLVFNYSRSFDFSAMQLACTTMPPVTKNIVFLCLLTGFGTKAGIVPLHIWLPYAHPQAPSHISSIMSGVMIKTAIYGLIRFVIIMLGVDAFWWGNLVLILASVSCLVGVLYALMEHDTKKLLAYHSVENIGIILLGVGASMVFINLKMPVCAVLAMAAGLYHLINHAVFKSLLFLCAGSVYKGTGLRDMEKLGGLIKPMPWTAISFLIGAMAISALPPLNGFISEWLTLQALFSGVSQATAPGTKILMGIYAAVLALTGGLAAACFVKAFGITFLAMPRSRQAKEAREVPALMTGVTVFMAALCLALGLFAVPVLKTLSYVSGYVTDIDTAGFSFSVKNLMMMPGYNGGASLSSPAIAIALVMISLAALAATYFAFGRRKVTVDKTWDCGYYRLDARNEYTSTAFSKPFRIALNFFYRPYRKKEETRDSHYHVKSRKYETLITPIFKKYFYRSIIKRAFGTANLLSKIQSGSIHLYLAYIFAAIVFLLIFRNRF